MPFYRVRASTLPNKAGKTETGDKESSDRAFSQFLMVIKLNNIIEVNKDIISSLAESATESLDSYYKNYIKNFLTIQNFLNKSSSLKSSIDEKTFSVDQDILRFSLIFNDLSLLNLPRKSALSIVMPTTREAFESVFSGRVEIIANTELFNHLNDQISGTTQLAPAFVMARDEECEKMLSELSPLINQGRLIVAPIRTVMYVEKQNSDGSRQWKMLEVTQDSSPTTWLLRSEDASTTTPIVYGADAVGSEREIFEITVPYFSGIPYKTLADILADEADLTPSLRVAIKEALSEVKIEGKTKAQQVISDVVEPKIGMIGRRFKSLMSRYRISLAGTSLATASLGLTTFMSTSSIVASVAAVAGAGGIGLLTKEYSALREKKDEIKEDPFYFLWRCKGLNK
jgi:hypothetical protein